MRRQMNMQGLLAMAALSLVAAGCQVDTGSGTGDDMGTGGGESPGGNGGESTGGNGEGGHVVDPDIDCAMLSPDDCPRRADCVANGDSCTDSEGADCILLRAEQCEDRQDCAPRADVLGDFSDCKPVGDVPCAMLDEDRCGGRDDCGWDGERCAPPQARCADHDDRAGCEANACHWWADTCNEGPEPARCDQPDEATCVAANCEWTPDGCQVPNVGPMACDELAEVACSARADCEWTGEACQVDPASLTCAELDANACALRNDCAFDRETGVCIDRPAGQCDNLDEVACNGRADCVAEYQVPEGCDCGGEVPPDGGGMAPGDPGAGEPAEPAGGGGGAPMDAAPAPPCPPDDPACNGDPPCGCPPVFVGCHEPQIADCSGLAPEACEGAAGCHLEEGCAPCPPGQVCPEICEVVLLCVADAGPACEGLDSRTCQVTPGCHLEGGNCDCVVGADGAEICVCAEDVDGDGLICVPDEVQPPEGCFNIGDEGTCWNTRGCEWQFFDGCDGGGAPVPCECAPDDPNCVCEGIVVPIGCGQCVDAIPVDQCNGLPPDICVQVEGCMVELIDCDCGVDENGEPLMCDCAPFENCVSAPQPCQYFDEFSCSGDAACEWFGFGAEPPPPDGCGCAAGDPNCGCVEPAGGEGGRPIAPDGFCQQRFVDPCEAAGADACEATPGCGLIELQPPCLPCDPDMPDCPVCEAIPTCVSLDQICGGLPDDACAADARCELYENEFCEGGGACPPGEMCLPVDPVCGVETFCGAARNRCVNIEEDVCAMMASCVVLSGADGGFSTCWDANSCDGLDAAQCDSHPSCHNEAFEGPCGCFLDMAGNEICECAPGGQFCVSDFVGPDEPVEPDPGAACRADDECPEGSFCDAMFGACVFPL